MRDWSLPPSPSFLWPVVDLERCKSVKKQGMLGGILEVLQVDDFYRYNNVDNQVFLLQVKRSNLGIFIKTTNLLLRISTIIQYLSRYPTLRYITTSLVDLVGSDQPDIMSHVTQARKGYRSVDEDVCLGADNYLGPERWSNEKPWVYQLLFWTTGGYANEYFKAETRLKTTLK